MTIRADIDATDIANLERDTTRCFTRERLTLAGTALLLTIIVFGSAFTVWRGIAELTRKTSGPLLGILAAQLQAPTPELFSVAASLAIMTLTFIVAAGVYKARQARKHRKRQEQLQQGVTLGRFDYQFTERYLVIKSPTALKKIAWSAINRIENTKHNLLFRKFDGSFEFLPKNAIKQDGLLKTLQQNHGASLKSNLSTGETLHAAPLSVTFERTAGDLSEYRAHYHKQREGAMNIARRFAQWRPLPGFLFLTFTTIAVSALCTAFFIVDLFMAFIGIAAAIAAAGIFITNARYFRGPAHPFRKDGRWPYGQSELTAATLSKAGLFVARNGVTEAIDWQGVQQFIECRLTSYFVITPGNVIPVPKRAFVNAEHYRAFASFAKARLNEAGRARAEHQQQRLMSSLGAKKPPVSGQQPSAQKPTGRTAAPATIKPQTSTAAPMKKKQQSASDTPVRKAAPVKTAAPKQQAHKPALAKPQRPKSPQKTPQQQAINGQAVKTNVASLDARQVLSKHKAARVKTRKQAANG